MFYLIDNPNFLTPCILHTLIGKEHYFGCFTGAQDTAVCQLSVN